VEGLCGECKDDGGCKDPTKPTCNAQGKCVGKGPCCQNDSGAAGCLDPAIEACVCAEDPFCCNQNWDEECVTQITALSCGTCP
jgi:hypothetical protein